MDAKTGLRAVFAASLLVASLVFVGTNVFGEGIKEDAPAEGAAVTEPRDGITVATAHRYHDGQIVAIAPNGSLLYSNATYDGYWDVDPSPKGAATVEYVASDELEKGERGCATDECVVQIVERANLTTGEVTRIHTEYGGQYAASEWHDVDRINGTHLLVADMYNDRVFALNTSSDLITWEWQAQSDYPIAGGGPYPEDWAHLNDVELLDDGRVMVSLRNQDQVVFIDRETGLVEDWTLGAEDDHATLYEQHNPDYIPPEDGGPAVLVADSENTRIVEYQREKGEWRRTWTWRDAKLQWPRDADRLPNGNTLISDTYGNRVMEVDGSGDIVWSFDVKSVGMPAVYEAERLGTGDESAGGASAAALGLQSHVETRVSDEEETPLATRIRIGIRNHLPTKWVNGISSAMALWMRFYDLVLILFMVVVAVAWAVLEFYWSDYRFRSPITNR